MKLIKVLRILQQRLSTQGFCVTAWWAADHAVRIVTGANIERVSQVTPWLHVGGQYRRRGWARLQARHVTAVINLRIEFDDAKAGLAPSRYLYLPTVDDEAPTLEQLSQGVAFIAEEVGRGGSVYVHCGSGVGRAPAMAAAYLISTGLAPETAWARIRTARPFVRPTAVQVRQLERFAVEVGGRSSCSGQSSR